MGSEHSHARVCYQNVINFLTNHLQKFLNLLKTKSQGMKAVWAVNYVHNDQKKKFQNQKDVTVLVLLTTESTYYDDIKFPSKLQTAKLMVV